MAGANVEWKSSSIAYGDLEFVADKLKAKTWPKLLQELQLSRVDILKYWRKTRKTGATCGVMSNALEKSDKDVDLMYKGMKLSTPQSEGNEKKTKSSVDKTGVKSQTGTSPTGSHATPKRKSPGQNKPAKLEYSPGPSTSGVSPATNEPDSSPGPSNGGVSPAKKIKGSGADSAQQPLWNGTNNEGSPATPNGTPKRKSPRKKIINRTVIVKIVKQTDQSRRRSAGASIHKKYNGSYTVSDGTSSGRRHTLKVYGDLSKRDIGLFKEGESVTLTMIIVDKNHIAFTTRSTIDRYCGYINSVTPDERADYSAVSLEQIEELQQKIKK